MGISLAFHICIAVIGVSVMENPRKAGVSQTEVQLRLGVTDRTRPVSSERSVPLSLRPVFTNEIHPSAKPATERSDFGS
jgi:hypothetical protein